MAKRLRAISFDVQRGDHGAQSVSNPNHTHARKTMEVSTRVHEAMCTPRNSRNPALSSPFIVPRVQEVKRTTVVATQN